MKKTFYNSIIHFMNWKHQWDFMYKSTCGISKGLAFCPNRILTTDLSFAINYFFFKKNNKFEIKFWFPRFWLLNPYFSATHFASNVLFNLSLPKGILSFPHFTDTFWFFSCNLFNSFPFSFLLFRPSILCIFPFESFKSSIVFEMILALP